MFLLKNYKNSVRYTTKLCSIVLTAGVLVFLGTVVFKYNNFSPFILSFFYLLIPPHLVSLCFCVLIIVCTHQASVLIKGVNANCLDQYQVVRPRGWQPIGNHYVSDIIVTLLKQHCGTCIRRQHKSAHTHKELELLLTLLSREKLHFCQRMGRIKRERSERGKKKRLKIGTRGISLKLNQYE